MKEWPLINPLPSYGRGRDKAGGRYSSLIMGSNLTDVVITGTYLYTNLSSLFPSWTFFFFINIIWGLCLLISHDKVLCLCPLLGFQGIMAQSTAKVLCGGGVFTSWNTHVVISSKSCSRIRYWYPILDWWTHPHGTSILFTAGSLLQH